MINTSNLSKAALILKDKQVSYQELLDNNAAYSNLYKDKSYQKIAIYSENREEWVYAFYSAWQNNCIPVTIDFMSSVDDVSYILNDCKPDILFTSNGKLEEVNQVLKNLDYTPEVIVFDDVKLNFDEDLSHWEGVKDHEATAVIIYTSGTTGSPKGVMLSFNNLLGNLRCVIDDIPILTKERDILMFLPLHHILPLVGTVIAPFYSGSSVVVCPSMNNTDLMETLKNNEVKVIIAVPRLFEMMYKGIKAKIFASPVGKVLFQVISKLKARGLAKKVFKKVHEGLGGHLEVMVAGGAALPKEVGDFFYSLGFDILEGYGMTETAPMIAFTRPGHIRPGSPGQKVEELDVEIRDGEIVVSGSHVMQGYYNRPEETADIIKDGWLYTGDLGHFDKDGFLYITGRKKEIIVLSNGKNINPVELENKLQLGSPYIKEAAVFLHNNNLHAIIVPDYKELANTDADDLKEFFQNKVIAEHNKSETPYKRILQFTLTSEDIPRTRLGKIRRFQLAKLVSDKKVEKKQVADPDTEEYRTIKAFIEQETSSKISPADHLEFDIALDSLGKLSLIDFIQNTFGVSIEENELLGFANVEKLAEYVADNKSRHNVEKLDWAEILKQDVKLNLPKAWSTQGCISNTANFFFRMMFKIKSSGQENIPEGPCIFAPNHQSYLDGLLILSMFKRKTRKETYFYAKRKHVKSWFMKFLASKNNVIVMDLNKDLKESIQKLAMVLKSGKKIIIFPEGTRTSTGRLGDFKKTFAILSKELNVPVVPIAIDGAYKALPTGTKKPKLNTKIELSILPAIKPEGFDYDGLAKETKEAILEVTKH